MRIALNSTSSTNTVSVDDPDFEGRTALHLAAGKGYLGMTKLLLDLGASPSLTHFSFLVFLVQHAAKKVQDMNAVDIST